MKKFVRRCILLVVILLMLAAIIFFGRNFLIKQAIIAAIKHRTGADTTIARVAVQFQNGVFIAEDILLVAPKSPQNTARIQKVTAQFTVKELWHRFIHVSQLDIDGIDIQVKTADGQAFMPETLWRNAMTAAPKESAATNFDWTQIVSGKPEAALAGIAEQFETSKLLAEQKDRWQKQAEQMKQQNIVNILAELPVLKQQAEADYRAIQEAMQRDRTKLQAMPVPKLNPDVIAGSFIEKQTKQYWQQLYVWHDALRKFALGDNKTAEKPQYLHIEKTNMKGQIVFDRLPMYFNGTVSNFVQPLPTATIPTAVNVNVDGGADALVPATNIQATLNYATGKEYEELRVLCPAYQLSEQQLGDPTKIAINVSPGLTRFESAVAVQNDNISGAVLISQKNVRLTPVFPPETANSDLANIMRQSLSQADNLHMRVNVSGTRDKPVYQFDSNLGTLLAPQLETLATAGIQAAKTKLDQSLTADANQGISLLNAVVKESLHPAPQQSTPQQSTPQKPADELIQRGIQELPGLLNKLRK
jgi:hypothetical protein